MARWMRVDEGIHICIGNPHPIATGEERRLDLSEQQAACGGVRGVGGRGQADATRGWSWGAVKALKGEMNSCVGRHT